MGLIKNNIKFLMRSLDNGAKFGRTLTIGRLSLYVSEKEFNSISTGRASFAEIQGKDGFSERMFEKILGSQAVESIDISDYQNATITHDLNLPIPKEMRGLYDAVVDGGSLEHIFNAPIALKSYMELLKVGGSLFIFTMANNHFGHGLYQFSPEFFFRSLDAANGFSVKSVVVEAHRFPGARLGKWRKCYEVADPAKVGRRVGVVSSKPMMIMVHAVKKANVPTFEKWPLQSDYSGSDQSDGEKPGGLSKNALRASSISILKSWIKLFPERLRENIAGYHGLRIRSLSNRKHFKPWD